jgi:hypothetical protein
MRAFGNLKYRDSDDGTAYLLDGRPVRHGDMVMSKSPSSRSPSRCGPLHGSSGTVRRVGPWVLVRCFGDQPITPDDEIAWPPPAVVEHMRLREERLAEHHVQGHLRKGGSTKLLAQAQAALMAKEAALAQTVRTGGSIDGVPVDLGAVLISGHGVWRPH